MKFLEAQQKEGREPKKSILPEQENKMQGGSRRDQQKLDPKDPQSLISSPSAGRSTTRADVQKLASELGVSLSDVTGTGPGGTITEKDVRLAKREQK